MPRTNAPIYSLNGGEVSARAIARLDLSRLRYASETCLNMMPSIVGSLDFRPGLEYMTTLVGNAENKRFIPFVFSQDDASIIEVAEDGVRFLTDGAYVSRDSVTTSIENSDFSAGSTGWIASSGVTISGNQATLNGTTSSPATLDQEITIETVDQNTVHGLNVTVINGPVQVTIGTSFGNDSILGPFNLEDGNHSLGFSPGANTSVFLRLSGISGLNAIVDIVKIDGPGPIRVDNPWSASDLPSIKYFQSRDVVFIASQGYQQRRFERRRADSWSLVRYKTNDGPFDIGSQQSVTLTPSVLTGNGTLTASSPFFDTVDIGSLFRLSHFSQRATAIFSAVNDMTDDIRVSGVGDDRQFTVTITVSVDDAQAGTVAWDGEISLDRAIGEALNFTNFQTYTGDASQAINDNQANQIIFYRLRVSSHTAGTANVSISYDGGTTLGVARVTGITSDTVAEIEVVQPFGETTATIVWDRGTWSDRQGWPSSTTIFDGRLWWGRGSLVFGSVSDNFVGYDENTIGDSAPIIRSVGSGPERGILWLLPTQRLLAGTDSSEVSIRASSFDEPLTPSNFVPRDASTRGCADIQAVKVDSAGIFVQTGGTRVYLLSLASGTNDYGSTDLTELHPEICSAGVRDIAIQRNPDTRIWFVLEDGTVSVLTYEPTEQVVAWSRFNADGNVRQVAVIPGTGEEQVYFLIERTVGGNTVQYLERMASVKDTLGGTVNKNVDSFVDVTNSPASTTISGLEHLEGKSVAVWADGAAVAADNSVSTFTVSGGSITLPIAVSRAAVGLPYIGQWRSTKLAYGAALGTALSQRKRVHALNLVMTDTAIDGVKAGRSFSNLSGMPRSYRGQDVTPSQVFDDYDWDAMTTNIVSDPDARVHIQAESPYPVHISAMIYNMKTNDA